MNWTWYKGADESWMLLPEGLTTPYARIAAQSDYKKTVFLCDVSTVYGSRHYKICNFERSDLDTAKADLVARMRGMNLIGTLDTVSEEQVPDQVDGAVYAAIDTKCNNEVMFLTDMKYLMSEIESSVYRWIYKPDAVTWQLQEDVIHDSKPTVVATIKWTDERGGRVLARIDLFGDKKRKYCKSAQSAIKWIKGQVQIWDVGAMFVHDGE